MRGKAHGISCWSRFPLRMLSLQQTQRFADALAGAELARRRDGIDGEPFALGFFVGAGGTPNRIRDDAGPDAADATDQDMPRRNQVLLRCPFCRDPNLEMRFDRRHWLSLHCCTNPDCPWPEEGLPFRVVDEEIYRLLPSVIVGTLDKAASVAMQAAMRGLYAARSEAAKAPVTASPTRRAARPPAVSSRNASTDPGHSPSRRSYSRRRYESRTSSTSFATASARSTPTTRRSSTTCTATGSPVAEEHRLLRDARRLRGTGRSALSPRGHRLPASRTRRGRLLLDERPAAARAPLRRPRPARRHPRVRQRPPRRVAAASRPPPP